MPTKIHVMGNSMQEVINKAYENGIFGLCFRRYCCLTLRVWES